MNNIKYYKKNKLLSFGGNTKIEKNEIPTYNLSLLPHRLNSKEKNLCTFSTKECREICLNTAGRGRFTSIQEARRKRTEFFIWETNTFMQLLFEELNKINKKHEKSLVRLNTFSDVDWRFYFLSSGMRHEDFTNIIFYRFVFLIKIIVSLVNN